MMRYALQFTLQKGVKKIKNPWFKFDSNFFDDPRTVVLKSRENGDSIILAWIQLQSLAAKCRADGDLVAGNVPLQISDLAQILRMDESAANAAFEALFEFGILDQKECGTIFLTEWNCTQSEKIGVDYKEKNAERQRRFRERKQQNNVTQNDENSNVTVTLRNAPRERDKRIEKEKEKRDIKDNIYSRVIDSLNQSAGTSYKSTTAKTKNLIKARIDEGFTFEDFEKVILNKTSEWLHDSSMSKYLRPETLFGTKFESYLNQAIPKPKIKTGDDKNGDIDWSIFEH